jgi:hypothetical protein
MSCLTSPHLSLLNASWSNPPEHPDKVPFSSRVRTSPARELLLAYAYESKMWRQVEICPRSRGSQREPNANGDNGKGQSCTFENLCYEGYGCATCSLTLREWLGLRVSENRVLRKRFGHKRDEVTREWRRLRNEELYGVNSPNIIRVIRSRRTWWAKHVARRETRQVHTGFRWKDLTERDHFEDLGIEGVIVWNWIFKKWDGEEWTGFIWLRIWTGSRPLWMW